MKRRFICLFYSLKPYEKFSFYDRLFFKIDAQTLCRLKKLRSILTMHQLGFTACLNGSPTHTSTASPYVQTKDRKNIDAAKFRISARRPPLQTYKCAAKLIMRDAKGINLYAYGMQQFHLINLNDQILCHCKAKRTVYAYTTVFPYGSINCDSAICR